MKVEEHCIHGRDMVEDFHLSLEAIRLAKRSAWGANTEMQVLAVGIQWGMDEANKNIAKLEAENATLRLSRDSWQKEAEANEEWVMELKAENARYREALEFYADDESGTDDCSVARRALKGE